LTHEVQRQHPLLPNLDDSILSKMLERIGAKSIDELFSDIPKEVRLKGGLNIPPGASEFTVKREIQTRLSQNRTYPGSLCFLGGGVWPHYIPAVVESIMSRQEFYTSYTPYQAEISQGMLQGLFEYQSLMCDVLGMEACNSSLYDWASAAGEAVRMAVRVNGRKRILIAGNAGPQRVSVIQSYVEPLGLKIDTVGFNRETGRLDSDQVNDALGQDVAAVYFENPNYLGVLEEDAEELVESAHRAGALAIVGVDPISLSLVREPGSYSADIAVGEGQPLGIPMNYGGPHLGIFAVADLKLARSMPGRLIGLTTTIADPGQKAFAMVLQAREQHIRREAATSNICTNQSLMAIAAATYLSLLGKTGFRMLGESIVSNSHFAAKRIAEIPGIDSPLPSGPFFKEFVVGYPKASAETTYRRLSEKGVLAGSPIPKSFGLSEESGLYCVTEIHSSEDIERLARTLEAAL
jgi:glycine dehydrogenase subunit 1